MDPHWPWAAFVIGYDLAWLRLWVAGLWRWQDNIAGNWSTVPKKLPDEFEEFKEACNKFAAVPGVDVRTIGRLVAAANRLELTSEKILHEVRIMFEEFDLVGFSAEVAPADEALVEAEEASRAVVRSVPELELWRELGAFLAELALSPDWQVIIPDSSDANFAKLIDYCHRLNPEGDLSFLYELEDLADPKVRNGKRSGLWDEVKCGGEPDRINPDWLARHIKMQLWDHQTWIPYFEISADRLRLFGQDIGTDEFGHHNTTLLWVLCESPRTLLRQSYVMQQAGFGSKSEHLKTYVYRLREKLRPIVNKYFESNPKKPKNLDDCFIIMDRKGYCGLDTIRVNVKDPKPGWMRTRRDPASHEAKDWPSGDDLSGGRR